MSDSCTCARPPTLATRADDFSDPAFLSIDDQVRFMSEEVTRAAQVVVAEDDAEMRELLVLVLEADGHEVVEARNGDELLARLDSFWARGEEPDLVVSDVRMPGCTGLSVLAHMSVDGRFSPVILITGFGDHELHERAIQLGAVAVLDKPFDVDELRDLAKRILRGGQP